MGALNELLVQSPHYLLFKPRNERKLCYYEDLALSFRFVLVVRNPHLLVSFKNGKSNDSTSNSNKISKCQFGAPSSETATTLTPNITSRRKKSCKVIVSLKLSKTKNAFSSSKFNWISFGLSECRWFSGYHPRYAKDSKWLSLRFPPTHILTLSVCGRLV